MTFFARSLRQAAVLLVLLAASLCSRSAHADDTPEQAPRPGGSLKNPGAILAGCVLIGVGGGSGALGGLMAGGALDARENANGLLTRLAGLNFVAQGIAQAFAGAALIYVGAGRVPGRLAPTVGVGPRGVSLTATF